MNVKEYLTIGQLAARYGIADWQARRAVDAIGGEIPRAGLYRLVPCSLLGRVERELKTRGYLTRGVGTSA
jgi:hypothetical protein